MGTREETERNAYLSQHSCFLKWPDSFYGWFFPPANLHPLIKLEQTLTSYRQIHLITHLCFSFSECVIDIIHNWFMWFMHKLHISRRKHRWSRCVMDIQGQNEGRIICHPSMHQSPFMGNSLAGSLKGPSGGCTAMLFSVSSLSDWDFSIQWGTLISAVLRFTKPWRYNL